MRKDAKYTPGTVIEGFKILSRFRIPLLTGRTRAMGVFECPLCRSSFVAIMQNIARGRRISCGCAPNPGSYKHGLANTKISSNHCNMIQRCYNPNYPRYADWGGRGIRICERWMDIENYWTDIQIQLLLQGLILEDWGSGLGQYTLDRINNDGNYEPGNIRFSTHSEQTNNRKLTIGKDE